MDCSQILPGAVNSEPCSLATGYYNEHPFIVSRCVHSSVCIVFRHSVATSSRWTNLLPSLQFQNTVYLAYVYMYVCLKLYVVRSNVHMHIFQCLNPQVYASGRDIVILDGRLKHVQTLLGMDLGYGETPINCVHCAELVGKIAVTWGSDVVIFLPEPLDENQGQNNNEVQCLFFCHYAIRCTCMHTVE